MSGCFHASDLFVCSLPSQPCLSAIESKLVGEKIFGNSIHTFVHSFGHRTASLTFSFHPCCHLTSSLTLRFYSGQVSKQVRWNSHPPFSSFFDTSSSSKLNHPFFFCFPYQLPTPGSNTWHSIPSQHKKREKKDESPEVW